MSTGSSTIRSPLLPTLSTAYEAINIKKPEEARFALPDFATCTTRILTHRKVEKNFKFLFLSPSIVGEIECKKNLLSVGHFKLPMKTYSGLSV